MEWKPASEIPPLEGEHYGDWVNSVNVLATNGKCIFVCYYQYWFGEPEYNTWKISGRDGYNFGVKYWMPLPELP